MKRGYLIICSFFVFWGAWIVGPMRAAASDWEHFVFPEMKGWKQSGEIQTFSPKTLYEYIDGAADLYLAYDFQELKTAEFLNEKKASVIIDVYYHKTSRDAFGIYSAERPSDPNLVNVGTQGYVDKDILNFLTGNYYVKMNSFKIGPEDQEILITFAKRVVENLGEKGSLPAILSFFPEEGRKKNSERFISQKFLGYAFLYSAFTADYELSGKRFKLFVIEGADTNECKDMMQKYFQQVGHPEKNIKEDRYTITDPHHGEIELSWEGKHIWGVLDVNDPTLRSKYLKLFEEKLTRKR